MKVLKKAEVGDWSFRYICVGCDSELEVYPSDLKKKIHDGDYRDSSYETYFVNCEVCDELYTLPTKDIPKLIRKMAATK